MKPWGLIIHQEIAHHKNGLIVLFSLDTVLSIDSYVSCGISFVPKVLFANSGELMSRRPSWESDHLTACGWPIKRRGHCNFPVNEYFTVFTDLLFNIDCVFYFLFSGCCYLTMHVVDGHILLLLYAACPSWEICADVFLQFSSPLDEPIFVHLLYWHTSNEHVIGIGYLLPYRSTMWPTEIAGWKAKEPHRSTTLARMLRSESVLRMTHYLEF